MNLPIIFADQTNVVAIAAGGYHSMALKSDGTVVMWGDLTTPGFPLNQICGIGSGWDFALALRTGNSAPVISGQPISQSAQPGQTITFSVQAIGLAALQYQWQFNSVSIANATNSSLVLTNLDPLQQGYYQVIVSGGGGSVASTNAILSMLPSNATNLPANSTNWIQANAVLSVPSSILTNLSGPLQFQWLRDSIPIPGAIFTNYGVWFYPAEAAFWEGDYSVNVTGTSGTTNFGTWRIYFLVPGGVAGWGADDYGQLDRPAGLTSVLSLAAGKYHSVAAEDDGSVVEWGYNWGNVPSNLTNAVAVAAGLRHTLTLKTDGSIVSWGVNDYGQTSVPANATNVFAISAGGRQSLALRKEGTVLEWGQTNAPIPAGLTNVTAIASGTNFNLALLQNATVVAWGANDYGQTNVPLNLSNVVAIAASGAHALALKIDGTVVAWGAWTNIPTGLSNVLNVAAGENHSIALKNDGTLVCWGDNTYGQTNVISGLTPVKLIAGGGNFTLVSEFSPLVSYPVEVAKDLLLIYNTNSADSATVLNYYLQNRPMANGANVFGVGYTNSMSPGYYEAISPTDLTNLILNPVASWLMANPVKRPQYVILFLDLPSRVFVNTSFTTNGAYQIFGTNASVSIQILSLLPNWQPFVTCINMGGTNDCIAYINKITSMATNYSFGKLSISASAFGYGNTNYVLDGIRHGTGYCCNEDYSDQGYFVASTTNGLLACGVPANNMFFSDGTDIISNNVAYNLPHPTGMINMAGYITWGSHSSLGVGYATNGAVQWNGNSGWWLIETVESFNGLRYVNNQSSFIQWFSSIAFGGTNYSNTPIGAVTHVDEPHLSGIENSSVYFGLWATGKNFAICAWNSRPSPKFQAVGDPFVTK